MECKLHELDKLEMGERSLRCFVYKNGLFQASLEFDSVECGRFWMLRTFLFQKVTVSRGSRLVALNRFKMYCPYGINFCSREIWSFKPAIEGVDTSRRAQTSR